MTHQLDKKRDGWTDILVANAVVNYAVQPKNLSISFKHNIKHSISTSLPMINISNIANTDIKYHMIL